jgi:hypothetical protein
MRIPAHDLTARDLLTINDWTLHVTDVDHQCDVVVMTAEFDFPLRFVDDEMVNIAARPEAA